MPRSFAFLSRPEPAQRSDRRRTRPWAVLLTTLLTALATVVLAPGASARSTTVPTPTVEGPIPITADSYPWLSASFPGATINADLGPVDVNLAAYGYVEEEFFIEGTARQYSPAGAIIGEQPYKTRIVVRRPADLSKADGTVILEWINVTAQFDLEIDWFVSHEHFMRNGHVWVGVSVQRAGVQALTQWDPERYAGLTVGDSPATADSQSWDVFSQAAQALRHPGDVNPLPGLDVQRIIATGHSQSASRLAVYYNVIQPQHGLIDGFIVHGSNGAISKDLDVPVIRTMAEGDVTTQASSSEPDAEYFRRWEVAGTSHVGFAEWQTYASLIRRDLPTYQSAPCDRPPYSRIPFHYVQNAAYAAMVTWIDTGVTPPVAPRLDWVNPTTKARDEYGNALGGIRLPQHEVATAVNDGANTGAGFCRLFGSHVPFDDATLASLYPNHGKYVSAVNKATTKTVKAGFLLQPDAQATRQAAAQSGYGK